MPGPPGTDTQSRGAPRSGRGASERWGVGGPCRGPPRSRMKPGVQRAIVAITTMMATFLVMLDMTIANVALDHMRGTLSAGVDEITWVLTSFLVANAISLPVSGWLTDLLGRKRLFIVATAAFTITSGVTGRHPAWL